MYKSILIVGFLVGMTVADTTAISKSPLSLIVKKMDIEDKVKIGFNDTCNLDSTNGYMYNHDPEVTISSTGYISSYGNHFTSNVTSRIYTSTSSWHNSSKDSAALVYIKKRAEEKAYKSFATITISSVAVATVVGIIFYNLIKKSNREFEESLYSSY